MTSDRSSLKLIQGTVDILILKALTRGPNHGYGLSAWIRDSSDGELGIEDAALYQALHRLERRELVESEWGTSENNRRAKYYEITSSGRARLNEEWSNWRRYATAVFQVLEAT